MLAARLDQAIVTAGPILNSIYKNMYDENSVAQYFAILDLLQTVSLHRSENPLLKLILFHSMHASIFYAVWYGLFDTLEVIAQKIEPLTTVDLVAVELEYPVTEFAEKVIDSVKAYSESLEQAAA